MKHLLQGIHKFQRIAFAPQKRLFTRLANKQSPAALFITCADSRVVPNLITQTQPGELFAVRNVGNIVPPYDLHHGESSAIEYALNNFDIKDVIVCGHSNCGAMQGLLAPESALDKLPATKAWLQHAKLTREIVQTNYAGLTPQEMLEVAIQENVLVQLEHLREHPSVKSGLAARRFNLHGWVYDIESGDVLIYDPTLGKFQSTTKQSSGRTRSNNTRSTLRSQKTSRKRKA
jgi:carbonic anhydrase